MRFAGSGHSEELSLTLLLLFACCLLVATTACSTDAPSKIASARRYLDVFEFDRLQTDLIHSKFVLLDIPVVCDHLGISSQQVARVHALFRTPMKNIPGVSDLLQERKALEVPEADRKTVAERHRTALQHLISNYHEAELTRILDARQASRLSELLVQMRGPVLLLYAPWKADIRLSDEQVLRIEATVGAADKTIQPMLAQYGRSFISGVHGDQSREEIAECLRVLLQERDTAILVHLTDEQRESFLSLQGARISIEWKAEDMLKEPFQNDPSM